MDHTWRIRESQQ